MGYFSDSLRGAIQAVTSPFQRGQSVTALPGVLNFQLAFAAYQSSGLLAKVINIPAADRVREWRDWQAEKPVIEALEAEERRLGLKAKVQQAEVLRGIGGGALILAAPGDPASPIERVGKGQLAAVNVASRWQLTLVDVDTNMTSITYGWPRMFRMQGATGQIDIHPSRVVCFRGDPLPAGMGISDEERFWGSSRLMRVLREVENSDSAQRWFAELVRKAKLTRYGIYNLTDFTATADGRANLASRVQLMAEGESTLNATVYSLPAKNADGSSTGGEQIDDYQVTWTGIPAMMDAFDQRVAAVSDIPFTRLMGRSPAGMNATGAYDDQNWAKAVSSGQQLETRPCLEQLDPILIASAGAPATGVTWKWAPLWAPTEKEESDTFKTTMDAVKLLIDSGTIPQQAMARGVQNLMSEREWIPGLDQALALIPEAERFGLSPEPDGEDPSALQGGGDPASADDPAGDGGAGRRRAANDKVTVE
jgi:hypothetical protein